MAQEQNDWFTNLVMLLDKLPSEFKSWAIVGVLIAGTIGGAVWLWRKGKDKPKEESKTAISVQNSIDTHIHTGTGDLNVRSIVHKPKE